MAVKEYGEKLDPFQLVVACRFSRSLEAECLAAEEPCYRSYALQRSHDLRVGVVFSGHEFKEVYEEAWEALATIAEKEWEKVF